MNEPFKLSSDMLNEIREDSYDAPRSVPRTFSPPEGYANRRHSGGATPGPQDHTQTFEALLADRGKTHGDFNDHAHITQMLKRVMHTGHNWGDLSDMQKESLEMIVHKIGRILSGNPGHRDHWDDIMGYAKLVSQKL